MSMTRPPYPSGFREQMVDLVRSGRSPEELSREFEPSAQSIRNWVDQADRDAGRGAGGLTGAEREELRRLRRENRRLRQEREILAKAAAWFARETDSIPSGSSSRGLARRKLQVWKPPPSCSTGMPEYGLFTHSRRRKHSWNMYPPLVAKPRRNATPGDNVEIAMTG